MKNHALLSLLLAIPLGAGATAEPAAAGFNWSLLKGKWAESTDHQFGCRPDNLHQWFAVSKDRKTLIFKNDRKWKIGSGEEVKQYSASIVSASPNLLVIRYGDDLAGIPDEYREWEMRFIGPGTYRWRSTSWKDGVYNNVVGVKCASQ